MKADVESMIRTLRIAAGVVPIRAAVIWISQFLDLIPLVTRMLGVRPAHPLSGLSSCLNGPR